MMKNFKELILIVSVLFGASAQSENLDIGEKLLKRNRLTQLTQNPLVKSYLFDSQVRTRLNQWKMHEEIVPYVVDCETRLKGFFKSSKVLAPVCYLLRQDDLSKRERIFPLLEQYMLEIELAYLEIAEDPRATRGEAYADYLKFKNADMSEFRECFAPALNYEYPEDLSFEFSPFAWVAPCLTENFSHLTKNLVNLYPDHPGHLVSETGWLRGNAVEYFSKNDLSAELHQTLLEKNDLIPNLYPLEGRGALSAMLQADLKDVFTEEEGFLPVDQHMVWTQRTGIFHAILESVNSAEQSLFIDIFFLGGTMGAALVKHLTELLEEKPQLKIMILRDQLNHFGHEPNMMPVFNFLLAYSLKNPDRMVVLPSSIKNHLSGLPGFIGDVLSDEMLVKTGLQKHLSLYGRAMSDHSKVIVADGKSLNPKALVGSKNLTDASGAYCYDELARVQGPGAAVVLDDYYLDMQYALREVDYSQAPYSLQSEETYLDLLAEKGWSAQLYRPGQSSEEKIANILRPFDLLERDSEMNSSVEAVPVEMSGSVTLRTGMTNVDSTRANLVDQVVQLIHMAQNQILIKDQYLFDRNVVLALIQAKKERGVDVKILLEPMAVSVPAGMPNLLYLDRLVEAGVEVKWMITHSYRPMVDGSFASMSQEQKKALHAISQELHMKTISADGRNVIVGSANKDQTTMYGAFREEQLDIVDAETTQKHDQVFFEYWNDENLSVRFEEFNFEVPEQATSIDGTLLTPKQFIVSIRNILSIFYDWMSVY